MILPMVISAYGDTLLPAGQTLIDTAGNPALGVISRSTGATALFNTAGTATATGTPLSNGILGHWAFIGTGTATRYATLDGSNNVVSYTAGTATTWGGTLNSTTANYEISAVGTATYGGSERLANTIRYTGGAGSAISLGNTSASGLTVNGLINAGTGTLTFQHGGGAFAGAGIHIGATQELVLNAANADINVNARVHNSSGGASGVTVVGSNTVTLSQVHTYTGATTVNAGTLALGAGGSIASSSGIAVNGGNFNVSSVVGYSTGASQFLTGNGTVIGNITVGGNLAIGASSGIGTMTFNNNLALANTSTSDFEFTLSTFTLGSCDLALGGAGAQGVTFDGILDLMFDSGETYANSSSVQIFDFETYAGNFDTVNFSGLGAGQSAIFDSTTGFVTVIPEPGSALLSCIGLPLVFLRRRRI